MASIKNFQDLELRTNLQYRIIFFYRSPYQTDKEIKATLVYFESIKEKVIIIGDLNIPDCYWDVLFTNKTVSGSACLKEKLTNILLLGGTRRQYVNFPTHKISKNILDVTMTDIGTTPKTIQDVLSPEKCDHELFGVRISLNNEYENCDV